MTQEQYDAILLRLINLENAYNNLAVALSKMVTGTQVQQLLVISQDRVEALQAQVVSLQEQVDLIISEAN